MARKRSGGSRGRGKRPSGFTVTCAECGKKQRVPVAPPKHIQLYCVACTEKREALEAAENSG